MLGTGRHQLKVPGTMRHKAGGVWWVVFGGRHMARSVPDGWQRIVAKIMTLVEIIF